MFRSKELNKQFYNDVFFKQRVNQLIKNRKKEKQLKEAKKNAI